MSVLAFPWALQASGSVSNDCFVTFGVLGDAQTFAVVSFHDSFPSYEKSVEKSLARLPEADRKLLEKVLAQRAISFGYPADWKGDPVCDRLTEFGRAYLGENTARQLPRRLMLDLGAEDSAPLDEIRLTFRPKDPAYTLFAGAHELAHHIFPERIAEALDGLLGTGTAVRTTLRLQYLEATGRLQNIPENLQTSLRNQAKAALSALNAETEKALHRAYRRILGSHALRNKVPDEGSGKVKPDVRHAELWCDLFALEVTGDLELLDRLDVIKPTEEDRVRSFTAFVSPVGWNVPETEAHNYFNPVRTALGARLRTVRYERWKIVDAIAEATALQWLEPPGEKAPTSEEDNVDMLRRLGRILDPALTP